MKWLLIALIGTMQSTNVYAVFFQQVINENYSLVHLQSGLKKTNRSNLYAVEFEYRSNGIGLAKDLQLSDSWRGSLGVIFSDDYVDLSTARTVISVQGRSFDLNQLLSAHARVEFSDIMPFVSLSYHYSYDDRLVLDVTTSLKFFNVQSVDVHLGNPLGERLQGIPQVSAALHQELNERLQDYYVYPVFDVKFNYSFN